MARKEIVGLPGGRPRGQTLLTRSSHKSVWRQMPSFPHSTEEEIGSISKLSRAFPSDLPMLIPVLRGHVGGTWFLRDWKALRASSIGLTYPVGPGPTVLLGAQENVFIFISFKTTRQDNHENIITNPA